MRAKNQLTAVVAYDLNRGIGSDGDMPWGRKLSADLKHFKKTTLGGTVVMGSTTFESLNNSPLPNRNNIVLSHRNYDAINTVAGATAASSVEHALELIGDKSSTYIIGGSQIYEQFIPYVGRVLASEVQSSFEDVDTYFPELALDEWTMQQEYLQDIASNSGHRVIVREYLRNE